MHVWMSRCNESGAKITTTKTLQQYLGFTHKINPCVWICPYLWCCASVLSAYDRPAASPLKLGSLDTPTLSDGCETHKIPATRQTGHMERTHKHDIHMPDDSRPFNTTTSWLIVSFTALTLANPISCLKTCTTTAIIKCYGSTFD